jgi:hypothetical protein
MQFGLALEGAPRRRSRLLHLLAVRGGSARDARTSVSRTAKLPTSGGEEHRPVSVISRLIAAR